MSLKNKIVLAAILVLMFLTILATVSIPLKVSSVIYERSQEEAKREQLEKEREEAFDRWLDSLVELECRNCPSRFRRIDVNGKYSYGCLQFQEATFEAMVGRFEHPAGGDPDSIYSCEVQRELAKNIFEADGRLAARHWHTSIFVKGLGLPPHID